MARSKPKLDVPVAVGFRAHSGWAAVVAVAGPLNAPRVIDRRRIELVDPAIAGSVQPYHFVRDWELGRAESFIEESSRRSRALASAALQRVIERVAEHGFRLVGCGLLLGSGRLPTTLAAILNSHPMIHTAEGEFFRNSLRTAAENFGVPVIPIDISMRVAAELRISVDNLAGRLKEIGRPLGPPWGKDQKLDALAGVVALAGTARS